MHGNDFQTWKDPAHDAVVLAVAQGIRDKDTRHLHTIELNYLVSGSLDETGGHDLITHVDTLTCFRTNESPYGPDAVAFDSYVSPKPRIAAAVHHPAAGDEEIKHLVSAACQYPNGPTKAMKTRSMRRRLWLVKLLESRRKHPPKS